MMMMMMITDDQRWWLWDSLQPEEMIPHLEMEKTSEVAMMPSSHLPFTEVSKPSPEDPRVSPGTKVASAVVRVLHCIYNYTDSCWFSAATAIRHSRHDISRMDAFDICECSARNATLYVLTIALTYWIWGRGLWRKQSQSARKPTALQVRQHWRLAIYWGVICKLNNVRFVWQQRIFASIRGPAETRVCIKCTVIDKINVCWKEECSFFVSCGLGLTVVFCWIMAIISVGRTIGVSNYNWRARTSNYEGWIIACQFGAFVETLLWINDQNVWKHLSQSSNQFVL